MGIRESLLNTITSVADSDFVRVVTSAGASSKATVRNLFKGFESNLSAKSSLTTSDYIRVVGSDNEAYKQSVSAVKTAMGVDNKIESSPTGTAGKITSLLLSKDSVGYYVSVWSTDDPSARRGYFRLDADTKTTSTITAEGGWTLGDFRTCAKVGSTVVFDYWCSYSGTPTTRQWITIGTIPSGYRPSYAYDMVAVDNSGVTSGVQIKVEASGAIKAYLLDNRSKGLRIHGVHFV